MSSIIKSAKKSLRQNPKRKIRNIRRKKRIKSLFKKADVLISQGKMEEAKSLLPQIYKSLDKATKTGVIKKSKASRRKSSIAEKINKTQKKG